MLAIVH
jgi:cytoplasmic iron level regulating protein YaaA (DUF328/UPF0246 family)